MSYFVNPHTGRPIKRGGATHRNLIKHQQLGGDFNDTDFAVRDSKVKIYEPQLMMAALLKAVKLGHIKKLGITFDNPDNAQELYKYLDSMR